MAIKRETIRKAVRVFKEYRGLLKTSQAIQKGIHPRQLSSMVKMGVVEQLGRGLYRLKRMPRMKNPDLTLVAFAIPRAVICLVSALAFHELTNEVPHEVYMALRRGDERPRLAYPPIRPFWFTDAAYSAGVETHEIDGISVKLYSAEKTITDCFKYRNKIGLSTALEALRTYLSGKRVRLNLIEEFARICRVQKVMRPYLEAML